MQKLILNIMAFSLLIFPFSGISGSNKKLEIVATTFPIFQITRNITEGREDVKVDLLIPPGLGCPHSYALTPQDMRRLSKADILIINGLGLEDFMKGAIKKANPALKLTNSSDGVKNILHYKCPHDWEHHEHHHDKNPHLFASPLLSAQLAEKIAVELSEKDPDGAVIYKKNSEKYIERMKKISAKFTKLGKELENNRVVQTHGIFDYLARDIGLKIIATISEEGQEPSASEMIRLIKIIKSEKVGAIITEPQYPDKIEKKLSKETKVPVIQLDPVASGPDNAPLDYYDTVMEKNLKILKETLGKN